MARLDQAEKQSKGTDKKVGNMKDAVDSTEQIRQWVSDLLNLQIVGSGQPRSRPLLNYKCFLLRNARAPLNRAQKCSGSGEGAPNISAYCEAVGGSFLLCKGWGVRLP
jgi:hypothetical protein